MTEENLTQPEGTENETSASSSEEQTGAGATQSPEGDNTQGEEEKLPFHQHPRWTEREEEWKKRFNESEQRHEDDMKKLREEFSGARKENAQQTQIPQWFGGTKEQWDAYRQDQDALLAQAEERALNRINKGKTDDERRVAEATQYMKSEIDFIGTDKTINPKGLKVDPEKLLKVVMDNDLIDSKGRWNYRAGFKVMIANAAPAPAPKQNPERKEVAAATTSESGGEQKPSTVKTSVDFKTKRPW